MSPYPVAGLLLALAGFCSAPAFAARHADALPVESPESARLYQAGVQAYAAGDISTALKSFRAALDREPGNPRALSAVRRLEHEGPLPRLGASEPARSPVAGGAFDRFCLVTLPRWFYFERTLGDALRDAGALDAANGRVRQLLREREFSLAQGRQFRKEGQLRALSRRAPVSAPELEEV